MPAILGVGSDGNYIMNCVVAEIVVVMPIYSVLSITVASAEKMTTPPILNIMLILLLLKLSNA